VPARHVHGDRLENDLALWEFDVQDGYRVRRDSVAADDLLLLAALASVLPNPPLTRDQVILMQQDNLPGEAVGTFADLGIEPRDLQTELAEKR
jgi:hypothetical protein